MPNTKITKQKWKDHYSYSKKIYIIGIIIAAAVASLIYSVTRYVPPNEKAVLIELVDGYVDTAMLEEDAPELLKIGQAYDETLEEIQFLSIAYTGLGQSETDYYGAQAYTVQLYAGDNDIYFQNELLTQGLIDQGLCTPLETLNGFDAFNETYPDAILWQHEPKEESEEEANTEAPTDPGPLHAYAVDVSSLTGFIERGAYDVRGKYASVIVTSKNADTSFYILTEMFRYYAGTPDQEPSAQDNAPAATPAEAVNE